MAENFGSKRVSDGGGGVCHLPKGFFFFSKKKIRASGFQTPSEDSPELCLSQTGLGEMRNFKPLFLTRLAFEKRSKIGYGWKTVYNNTIK